MNMIGINIMPILLASGCTGINQKLPSDALRPQQMGIYFCIAEKK